MHLAKVDESLYFIEYTFSGSLSCEARILAPPSLRDLVLSAPSVVINLNLTVKDHLL